jgi:hypothetical protein
VDFPAERPDDPDPRGRGAGADFTPEGAREEGARFTARGDDFGADDFGLAGDETLVFGAGVT